MKKIITATMIMMLACSISLLVCSPTVHANPAITIAQYTLSPKILSPGDTAILTLQIKNGDIAASQSTSTVGGGDTTTTTHTLATSIEAVSVVTVQSGGRQIRATQSYEDLGYLAAGASMEVNFKLLVDRNMSEGVYFPIVDIDVGTGTDIQYPVMIKVSNSSVTLLPTSIPSKISRGGTTELTVTAVNTKENTVSEVIITPHGDGVEFVPQSYFLGSLTSEASQNVTFSIRPSDMGAKDLTFTLSYKSGDNLHTNTMVTPVTVIDALDVAPIITGFPISITKGGSSRISIEVYNAKTEKITGVLITPLCNLTVIPSQYFIGSMEPDDVFSASFDIYANSAGLGTQTISFKVSFKQGNDYFETPLVSKSFSIVSGPGVSYLASGSSNTQSSSSATTGAPSLVTCVLSLVIIIVVIVVIVLFYFRWKKRRQAS